MVDIKEWRQEFGITQQALAKASEMCIRDRFGMLVDVEYSNRKNNRLKRLIRQAEFEQPDASIAAIDYQSGRKMCIRDSGVRLKT